MDKFSVLAEISVKLQCAVGHNIAKLYLHSPVICMKLTTNKVKYLTMSFNTKFLEIWQETFIKYLSDSNSYPEFAFFLKHSCALRFEDAVWDIQFL